MFLFTDLEKITTQTLDQAFGLAGSIQSTGRTKFQVTNKFQLSAGAKAYMPLRGEVAIVPQDANPQGPYANAVIKVELGPPSTYPPVTYIIYRGLLKSSLLDANAALLPSGTNDLLTRVWAMWTEDRKRTDSQAPATRPSNQAIGWQSRVLAQATDRLDTLFGAGQHAVGLPLLDEGQVLGTFADDVEVGVDIIIAEPLMLPTVALTRDATTYVAVTTAAATPALQLPAEKNLRAEILAYLDINVFYVLGRDAGSISYRHNGTRLTKESEEDVYKNVLVKFYGCNTIYLDLRNEVSLPLNHYNEYRNSSETSLFYYALNDNLTLDSFDENWPWPLYIIRNPNTSAAKVRLVFKTVRNADPLVYREYGRLSKDLRRSLGDQEDFISLYNDTYSNPNRDRSKELEFELTRVLVNNQAFIVGGVIRLMLLRRTLGTGIANQQPNVGNGPVREYYLDNVFGPIENLANKPPRSLTAKRWLSQGDLDSGKVVGAIVQVYRDHTVDQVVFTASVLATYASLAFDDDTQQQLQLSEFGKVMNRRRADNQYNLAGFGKAWEASVLGQDMRRVQVDMGPTTRRTVLSYWGLQPVDKQSLTLSFTRAEYDNLLPELTAFDLSLGGVFCFFRPYNLEAAVPTDRQTVTGTVYSTTLTLSGYVGSSLQQYYQKLGPGQLAFQERFYSLDLRHFATDNSAASLGLQLLAPPPEDYTIASYLTDLRTAEHVYEPRDRRFDQTVTRQRVHFYGYTTRHIGRMARGKGYIFNLYIPGAAYWEPSRNQFGQYEVDDCAPTFNSVPPSTSLCHIRQMDWSDEGMSELLVRRLSGDEFNNVRLENNQTPDQAVVGLQVRDLHQGATRLIDPGNNILDIGHTLYTLDALFTNQDFPGLRDATPTPGFGFSNLGVTNGVDLATFMGDLTVATGNAYNAFYNGDNPQQHPMETLLDLQYIGGSSLTDLYSDADGFGMHEAWVHVFNRNRTMRLSELVRHYYSEYVDETYTYKNRWKLSCQRYGLIHFDQAQQKYVWSPDLNDLRQRLVAGHTIAYLAKVHPYLLGGYLASAAAQLAGALSPADAFVLATYLPLLRRLNRPLQRPHQDYILTKFLTQVKALLLLEQPGKIVP